MAVFHVTPHRFGQLVGHARHMIGHVDKGVRTAGRVFHAVKEHVPDGKSNGLPKEALAITRLSERKSEWLPLK